jgi:hypothetical protein
LYEARPFTDIHPVIRRALVSVLIGEYNLEKYPFIVWIAIGQSIGILARDEPEIDAGQADTIVSKLNQQ